MPIEAIALREVTFEIAGSQILRGLSFTVCEGEVFAIYGPSGCGKSTSLRLISGIDVPTKGDAFVYGRAAAGFGPRERCVATVWQSRALFPHLDVRGNLEFGLRNRGLKGEKRAAKVKEIAERLGIESLLDRTVSSLSGGEQQRIALGRAMVVEPRILLLDEPFTGLDQMLRWQLLADFRRLLAAGARTYVLVSHEFETIVALADRAAVMNRGTIIQVDRPDAIWRSPTSGLVARLIGWSNVFPARAIQLDGAGGLAEVDVYGRKWIGKLRWPPHDSAESGDDAAYVVQPHEVSLSRDRECTVDGTFLGKETHAIDDLLLFELGGGGIMRVRSSRDEVHLPLTQGSKVPLSWDPSSALVVPP